MRRKLKYSEKMWLKPCSDIMGGPLPGALSFVNFIYILGKMLETCAPMTFPDFQRQMEWC